MSADVVPVSQDPAVSLSTARGLTFDQCVGHCCTTMNCAAAGWTAVTRAGSEPAGLASTGSCATFALGFEQTRVASPATSGGASVPSIRADPAAGGGGVLAQAPLTQGFALATPPASVDHIANGSPPWAQHVCLLRPHVCLLRPHVCLLRPTCLPFAPTCLPFAPTCLPFAPNMFAFCAHMFCCVGVSFTYQACSSIQILLTYCKCCSN